MLSLLSIFFLLSLTYNMMQFDVIPPKNPTPLDKELIAKVKYFFDTKRTHNTRVSIKSIDFR